MKINIREEVVKAALNIAADDGWDNVILEEISLKTNIPLKDIQEYFFDKIDILAAYGHILDKKH